MRSLLLGLIIFVLCSLSFPAGRRTPAFGHFAVHATHEANELDDL